MRWFTTKFAFAHKYQAMWDEQCISGALLPYLTEVELKDDVQSTQHLCLIGPKIS